MTHDDIQCMTRHRLCIDRPLVLENGKSLPDLRIEFHTAGDLSADRPIAWVGCPLPASSDVFRWWPGLFGPGRLFDPSRWSIICVSLLGSSYGTSGPWALDSTGTPYLNRFPEVGMRDIVKVFQLVRDDLGVTSIHTAVGPSMGGQQLLEWAIEEPDLIRNLVLIGCNARQSPFSIAVHEAQRMAIEADQTWNSEDPYGGAKGLAAARAAAVTLFRSFDVFQATQDGYEGSELRAAKYIRHQGEALVSRPFGAVSYRLLTLASDRHDVGRGRGGVMSALQRVQANTLVLSLSSDMHYPPQDQRELAVGIRDAVWRTIETDYGHDGFLKDAQLVETKVREFLSITKKVASCPT